MNTLQFTFASIVILLTPGPTNTILAASGSSLGFRRAFFLPGAEAFGYIFSISFFIVITRLVSDAHYYYYLFRLIASVWLLISAAKLWLHPFNPSQRSARDAFVQIFMTTTINPKAMLVGTVLVPRFMPDQSINAVVIFALLSTMTGIVWSLLGASLPNSAKRYAYKVSALIVGGFAVAIAGSTFQV